MGESVKSTIMAIGAHADDVEIRAGGTLAKYHGMGYEVVYVLATNNTAGSIRRRWTWPRRERPIGGEHCEVSSASTQGRPLVKRSRASARMWESPTPEVNKECQTCPDVLP